MKTANQLTFTISGPVGIVGAVGAVGALGAVGVVGAAAFTAGAQDAANRDSTIKQLTTSQTIFFFILYTLLVYLALTVVYTLPVNLSSLRINRKLWILSVMGRCSKDFGRFRCV